jgi:serine/threonine-protein kinase
MEQFLKSKYRVGPKLSENPFSITYQGFFIGTDKPVIIKVYKRGTLNSTLIKDMKQRVLSFSLINHHGIAKLLEGDYGWQGFYYVREFIEGQNLQQLMAKEEKLGVEKACAIADQVLSALEAAHAKGIVHAGLKPSNIYIDGQGIIKVTDFVIEGEIKAAMPQKVLEIMINAKYASPEELEGKPITPASDVYALGLILYEMAAGKSLLPEAGLAGNIQKMRPLGEILPKDALANFPQYLREILIKALDGDPLLRFASAKEFREALEKRSMPQKPNDREEYVRIFESTVTQYGGEEIDKESESLRDLGRVRLRWGKEKHRNWLLATLVGLAVVMGFLYVFFFGR